MASALKTFERIHIAMRVLITADFFKNDDVKSHKDVLTGVIGTSSSNVRHAISNGEYMFQDSPSVFPVLIKTMYDEDVLDEETILFWAGEEEGNEEYDIVGEEKSKVCREKMKPLVEWLEVDDESDEEEED